MDGDIQSPPKVLEQQDNFLCFCYTLKTFEFEVEDDMTCQIQISAGISWHFYLELLNNLSHFVSDHPILAEQKYLNM